MPKYIKSHSNYVLKSFHQLTNDGTIYERDITTIGGVGNFPNGQTPIYRSNNFIITVRDDGGISNQYNRKKWTENKVSGNIWTATALKSIVSNDEDDDDTKIVLKQDYYDFRDFCYYGSLSEMFRASITDIIARFPGELYGTDKNVYYTKTETVDGSIIEDRLVLGSNSLKYIVNPFGIDMHSAKVPEDATNPLKYFANGGYSAYTIDGTAISSWKSEYYYSEKVGKDNYIRYTASTDSTTVSSATSETYYPCKGDKVAQITLNGNVSISAYLGDNDVIYYLYNDDISYYYINSGSSNYNLIFEENTIKCKIGNTYYQVYHDEVIDGEMSSVTTNSVDKLSESYIINNNDRYYCQFYSFFIRPKDDYINAFYNECDNFQKLILNRNTTPKYKAVFSVIKENDYGYYRDFEEFVFPTSEGGYNIDASSYGFNTYTTRLSQIGEFYDEFFTDNLYRSMTHEAIKNFDWTYTREYVEGDEEEYVLGGQKMQKALRVFAREFDEILAYINNIKNLNRVTYDERSNLPDYFLTDTVENEGWNVELITPFDISGDTSFISGDCVTLKRHFVESSGNVTPYSSDYLKEENIDLGNGYFISCCSGGSGTCKYKYYDEEERSYKYRYKRKLAEDSEFTQADKCAANPIIRNRIKPYSDKKIYTYRDVNNEFLRRLKLNSRAIWRHKGTIEGIDMILGMFGFKNKEWVERKKEESYYKDKYGIVHPESGSCYDEDFDYEITEYIASANTISDCWDEPHQMYHIDWVNSTKTITYDYRSLSNYNRDASDVNYLPYQGLPVKYVQNNDNTRTLYPNFEKYEQYDGNPYFQMRGGWQDKAFKCDPKNDGCKYYPFQFDVDDNIVYNTKKEELFKETVRNIRRFDTIQDMLSVPSYEVHNGQIVYVSKIEDNIAELAGLIYPIKQDRFGKYIELIKTNGVVRAGDDFYFDELITVYDRYGSATTINITELPNGQVINCYIVNGGIQCHDDYHHCDEYFNIIYNTEDDITNYFQIGEFWQSNRLYKERYSDGGWKRLSTGETSCKMLNTIINDNKGNSPHNGMMRYDNGKEYFSYYEQLFKYALENDMFDDRCYDDYDAYTSTIGGYGFDFSKEYNKNDFGEDDYYSASTKIDNYTNEIMFEYKLCDSANCSSFTSTTDALYAWETLPSEIQNKYTVSSQAINTIVRKYDISNTKVNTKVIKITFNLHNQLFTDGKGDCEMKYIDSIVMNYLTQMIPSTAILQIRYISPECRA